MGSPVFRRLPLLNLTGNRLFRDEYSFQFCLCQCNLLLFHSDIFTEELHSDNITEQRQFQNKQLQKNKKRGKLIFAANNETFF